MWFAVKGCWPHMILLFLIMRCTVHADNTRVDRGNPAIAVLSIGYQSLGSCSRAAGWSAATSCIGTTRTCRGGPTTSASLIGPSGSSSFRLSINAMSMSLAGSCFSPDSAPRPFHHGIRRRGGTIFAAALPLDQRQVQADMRTHLIHRPARDIIPPLGGSRVFSYYI